MAVITTGADARPSLILDRTGFDAMKDHHKTCINGYQNLYNRVMNGEFATKTDTVTVIINESTQTPAPAAENDSKGGGETVVNHNFNFPSESMVPIAFFALIAWLLRSG